MLKSNFKAVKSNSKAVRVRSVSRALRILEILATEGNLGLVSISKLAGLDPTTTSRLLRTMEEHSFIYQNPVDGKYGLGIRAYQIGNSVENINIMRQIARPFLQTLMERTQETASIAIRDDLYGIYIEQVAGPHFLPTMLEVGKHIPLYATAVGKVLLTKCTEKDIERMVAKGLKRYTFNTKVTRSEIMDEIKQCKKQGHALDLEEFELGVRCVGVPVFEYNGRMLGAISVSGSSSRLSLQRLCSMVPILTACAAELSQAFRLSRFNFANSGNYV
jgi:IclR family KDG regulon transcriptional repressor